MNAALVVFALLSAPTHGVHAASHQGEAPAAALAQFDDAPPPPLPGEEAPPPPASDAPPKAEGSAPAGGEAGFMERFFPLQFNENLHPDVKDNQLMFFLGGLLFPCAGNAWLPGVASNAQQPEGFLGEAFLIWAAHFAVHFIPLFLVPCGCGLALIPVVGGLLSSAFFSVLGLAFSVNGLCCLVNGFYFTPVAVANAWDRKAKEQGIAPRTPTSGLPPEAPAVAAAMAF
jgi:hypothetical protein